MNTFQKLSFASIVVTLFACGGGGGGGTPAVLKYKAPVMIALPSASADYTTAAATPANYNNFRIIDVASNGRMIGEYISTTSVSGSTRAIRSPHYWSSLDATAVAPTNSGIYTFMYGVNSGGSIVGTTLNYTAGVSEGTYWSSAASAPTTLGTDLELSSINNKGEIVGAKKSVSGYDGVYFQNSTATLQTLTFTPSPRVKTRTITESGRIFGYSDPNTTATKRQIFWTNKGVEAQYLPSLDNPTSSADIDYVNTQTDYALTLNINAVNGFSNNMTQKGGIWTPPSGTVVVPIETSGTTAKQIASIGRDGVIGGYGPGNGTDIPTYGYVWKDSTTTPVDVNTIIPTGTGWVIYNVKFQLADGTIIGQGAYTSGGTTTLGWYYAKRD